MPLYFKTVLLFHLNFSWLMVGVVFKQRLQPFGKGSVRTVKNYAES